MAAKDNLVLGGLFQDVVNRVSHQRGRMTGWMEGNSVTLPQILILDLIAKKGPTPLALVAETMQMSLSSTSQILERLVRQDLLRRAEHEGDRRKKILTVTAKAMNLLETARRLRTQEFARELGRLPKKLRDRLETTLKEVLSEIEKA